MASDSWKARFQGRLEPNMWGDTSTPMCSSLDDSGYHSKSTELVYTPYLNVNRRHFVDTPVESPLPPPVFNTVSSPDSVVQVLFDDEDLARITDSYCDTLGAFSDISHGTFSDVPSENSKLSCADVEPSDKSCTPCTDDTSWYGQYGSVRSTAKDHNTLPRKPKYSALVPWPGQEIGEPHIDFFRELGHYRNCMNIVYRICDFLSPPDLVSASQVCHMWRKFIQENPDLNHKRTTCLDSRSHKGSLGKENHRNSKSLFRVPRPIGNALRSVGNQVCSPQKLSPVKVEAPQNRSRLPLFQEQAKKLLPCEHLQPCPRCQSPSRVTPAEKRARCTRTQCSFDYCTQCRNNFHAPTPCKKSLVEMCMRSPTKKKRDLICHKGARRNLRRL